MARASPQVRWASVMAIGRESFFWHKLHSLTGVLPIGFYMIQHLTLNSFSLAGAEKFNGVIGFFSAIPAHVLLVLEIGVLGLPILFHSIYGLFITARADLNYANPKYRFAQNRMFLFQRITGVALFFFLIAHVMTTTVVAKLKGHEHIEFAAWHAKLTANGNIVLILYMIGVVAAAYHLAYGIWNFCIRWGITVSEVSQRRMQAFSFGFFWFCVLLGWAALFGFVRGDSSASGQAHVQAAPSVVASGSR